MKTAGPIRLFLSVRIRWVWLAEFLTALVVGQVSNNLWLALGIWIWVTFLTAFARHCPEEWL